MIIPFSEPQDSLVPLVHNCCRWFCLPGCSWTILFFLLPISKIRYNRPARTCLFLPCLASDFLQGLVQRWHSPPKTGIVESSDSVHLCRSTAQPEFLHTKVHRQLHSHTRSLSSLTSKRFSVEPFRYVVFLEYLSLSVNNSIKSFQVSPKQRCPSQELKMGWQLLKFISPFPSLRLHSYQSPRHCWRWSGPQ